jgi:anti-sigma B factor antagonist
VIQALEINSTLLRKELDVMKPDQIAMAASADRRIQAGAVATVANQTQTAFKKSKRSQPASSNLSLVPARAPSRVHTLILTGELDCSSAQALEAEIDRLCEEGVAGITLDLRELTYIDSVGVAVIALRCGLCQRRGYEFALIPGSRLVHRVFEHAGVADLLPFQEDAVAAPRRLTLARGGRSRAVASSDRQCV